MEKIEALIEKLENDGYNGATANARIAQDIVLKAIKNAKLDDKIAIKGGVLIRNISKDVRRATMDLDIDFVKYSIGDDTIFNFIKTLNENSEYDISISGDIEELKHEDYKGKRIFIKIQDDSSGIINSKIDIGVHTYKEFRLEELYFEIVIDNEGISLLGNSKEQIVAEKLKSLLKFGVATTRYKDIFDIAYLLPQSDRKILKHYIDTLIIDKTDSKYKSIEDINKKLKEIFADNTFLDNIINSKKNWLGDDLAKITKIIIDHII